MIDWSPDPVVVKARQRVQSHLIGRDVRMSSGPGWIVVIPVHRYRKEDERFWDCCQFGTWSEGLKAWTYHVGSDDDPEEWLRRARTLAEGRRTKGQPYLAISVPSEPGFYRRDVAAFWKSKGFRWDSYLSIWVRRISGNRWTPADWLRAAQRYYDRLWPGLRWGAAADDKNREENR